MLGIICGVHRWEPELGAIYRCSLCNRTGYRALKGKLQGEIVPHRDSVATEPNVTARNREGRSIESDWRVIAIREACEDTDHFGRLRF